ncbi:AsnC family transcriptional regulator [Inmirania thermothiophila]|uniref:siroheme decarboxylase n=1 Tax=Inmirania thermothiophila TaxID=1750597 RepID=A0A3N1XWE8_9GAMM|nr:AsnC family transcriptional regulator [Inmirania thermothiophila]ROR29522.1 DNA-binding Lrp family transcriptional regulator [Inmirania thermothiophila]
MDALTALDPRDRALLGAIQDGLPLVARPYRAVGERLGMDESEVILRLARLLRSGVIRRLGLVVRHHELGYRANAMVVWDVPDEEVDAAGARLAAEPAVHLCYRRRRHPRWPYNLYCMVHGRDREAVLAEIEAVTRRAGLAGRPRRVLFSRRRFKQRGARYVFEEPGHASA